MIIRMMKRMQGIMVLRIAGGSIGHFNIGMILDNSLA